MRKKELFEHLHPLVRKYMDLVWYARSDADSYPQQREGILNSQKKIEELYPKDIEDLDENPDWQHGFNSGMLAGLRYIMTLDDEGKEIADDEFPELYI